MNAGGPAVGQDLTIRLSAFDGTGGIRSQGQFDNVRLRFVGLTSSIPTVGEWGLLVTGVVRLTGLALVTRRLMCARAMAA